MRYSRDRRQESIVQEPHRCGTTPRLSDFQFAVKIIHKLELRGNEDMYCQMCMESIGAVFKSNGEGSGSSLACRMQKFHEILMKFHEASGVQLLYCVSLHESTTRLLVGGLLFFRCSEFQ